MRLFRKQQQLLICVLAAVMVLGFVVFRYLPLQSKIIGIKKLRAETESVISKASIDGKRLPRFREGLLKLQKTVENYDLNIPLQRDLGLFLQQIANLMNDHKLKEQMVQPDKETQVDGLNCIQVNMRCRGGLEQVYEFYKSLQNLDRLVRIEHVKLMNNKSFSGDVIMETKAVVYYRTQAEQG